jgi:hypothetical protein
VRATLWVLSVRVWEGPDSQRIITVHTLHDSEADAVGLRDHVVARFGPQPELGDLVIDEVPATWSCDGHDGCMVS